MLKSMIEQMLPPGALDEFITGAAQAMETIKRFDATMQRIESRLYNIEIDLQTLLTGEVQAEKMPLISEPALLEHMPNDNGNG